MKSNTNSEKNNMGNISNVLSSESKKELFSIIVDEMKQKSNGVIVIDNLNGKLDFHKFGVPIHYSMNITANEGDLYKFEVKIKNKDDISVGPFTDILSKDEITDTLFEYINLTKKEIQWYDELFMEGVKNSGKAHPNYQ